MSALSVGSTAFLDQAARSRSAALIEAADLKDDGERKEAIGAVLAPTKEDALSTIVKWVPGEVIGTYAAVVAALQATSEDRPERATGAEGWLLVVFMVGALLLTVLGGYNAYRKVKATGKMPGTKRAELFVRGGLSALGLLIWSCVIPGTVSSQSGLLTTYAGAASAMVLFVAIIFGLFAEFMVLPATLRGLNKRLG